MDAPFEAARDRLVKPDSWILDASGEAYRGGITGHVRIGPLGAAPGISRLAEVRFRRLAPQDERAGLALRWEVRGLAGGLFPVLDADLVLRPAAEDTSLLVLEGTYRPPLGSLGAGIDRLVLHRVAQATVRNFLLRVSGTIARPRTSAA